MNSTNTETYTSKTEISFRDLESQLKQLQAENEKLQEKLNVVEDAHFNQSDLMMKLNKELQDKLGMCVRGLEFYADLQSWCMDGIRLDDTEKFDHSIYKIGGKLARETLAKLKETK